MTTVEYFPPPSEERRGRVCWGRASYDPDPVEIQEASGASGSSRRGGSGRGSLSPVSSVASTNTDPGPRFSLDQPA